MDVDKALSLSISPRILRRHDPNEFGVVQNARIEKFCIWHVNISYYLLDPGRFVTISPYGPSYSGEYFSIEAIQLNTSIPSFLTFTLSIILS